MELAKTHMGQPHFLRDKIWQRSSYSGTCWANKAAEFALRVENKTAFQTYRALAQKLAFDFISYETIPVLVATKAPKFDGIRHLFMRITDPWIGNSDGIQ